MAPKIRLSLLSKPFYFLSWFILAHVKVCLYAFDPIHDAPPSVTLANLKSYRAFRAQSDHKLRRFFILPVCVWLFLFVDTIWIMYQHGYDYEGEPMPELFTHRMYSPKFWQQGDLLVLTVSSGIGLIGLTFLCSTWLDDRYCMYFVNGPENLVINGKVWDRQNSEKLYEFRRKSKQALLVLGTSSQLIGYLFFLWNFLHSPFHDFVHHFKMWIYLPVLTWYCIYTVALMFYHFFVVTKYVMIKQTHLIESLDSVIQLLESPTSNPRRCFIRNYHHFRSINSHLAYQCTEIRGYNNFWSTPLTILFGVEIITFCYLLYSCLFYEQTVVQFIYFFFYLIELGGFIFAVIYRASIVDHNNDRCYARNVKVCVLFQLNLGKVIPMRLMLNIDKIATNRNFSRCCFRLRNSYRLDSTAFNMAIFIISTFFLNICQRNRRQVEGRMVLQGQL